MGKTLEILSIVFAVVGLVLWSIQLIPQIWLNFKRKTTEGLSVYGFAMWYTATIILGVYLIQTDQLIILVIQAFVFGLLNLIIIFEYLVFDSKFSRVKIVTVMLLLVVIGGIVDVGVYMALQYLPPKTVLLYIVGISTICIMVGGFFPQFIEIMRLQTIEGISFIFVAIDSIGGLFLAASVFTHPPIDLIAMFNYFAIPACHCVVIVLCIYVYTSNKRKALIKVAPSPLELEQCVAPVSGDTKHQISGAGTSAD